MFSGIVILAVLGLGIFYLVRYLREVLRYYSLLFKLPGPKWTPFLGQLPELFCSHADLFKKMRQWSREHGPVYVSSALYYASVNISGPEEFELVCSSMRNLSKGNVYNFMQNWLGSGLLTSTGQLWHSRRKILTPTFHFSILQDFVNVFNRETENLVQILKKKQEKPVNVIPVISQSTLKMIVETAMGSKLNLQKESDNNYVEAIHHLGRLIFYRILRPWTYNNFLFYNLNPKGKLEAKLLEIINTFINKVIRNREQNFEKLEQVPETSDNNYCYSDRKKLAMLDLLLNAKVTDGSIGDEGIKDEVNTIMFEGHDTTSMAICFMLMLLAYQREAQDLVYEEIVKNLQENKQHFSLMELNGLKYMEYVIKECLRLYPSVPIIMRNIDEDIQTIEGFKIPRGANAFLQIYDLHRNPKYWPEPEKFDPYRFLPENCVNRHPFAYVPFSAGPRNCIGQKFAMLEMKAVLCGILRNFILEPVDTPETVVIVPDLLLRPENDSLLVKFVNRF